MHSMNLTQLEEINTLVKHSAVRKKNPLVTHHRRPIGLSKNLLIMRYFNWLCCRVWVHVHCFFQRPYPLDNDIIFPVALPFAKKKRKIEKIVCVAGVERWRELGGRKIGRGLCLFPCIFLSPPLPFPPLPFLRLPRRLRKKWIGCLLEHRKKLYNNPRTYANAKQFFWRTFYVQ